MFASLLRSKKSRPSENTPLLAALGRYHNRHNGEVDEAVEEAVAQYDDEGEDEDEDRRRDGSLLPVFSSTFLGMRGKSLCSPVPTNF
jgi:hypothetical protein